MKWDPDKALAQFEPESCPGTTFTRILMDLTVMKTEGIRPTAAQALRGGGNVWCLGIGYAYAPKAFFYGQTMREAFLKARRAAKSKALGKHTPWGRQQFDPVLKKKKSPDMRKSRVKVSSSTRSGTT